VLVREPRPGELQKMQEFLGQKPDEKAWADLALGLINLNEFIYVP
jgi:hypothetical protein